LSIYWPNKRLKRDCQRVATLVQNCSSVFTVCFLSSAVRCQPLSRALCLIHKNQQVVIVDSFGISFWFCRQFNIVCRCLMKQQCIWC
ncbi:hypothetical protein DD785_12175, partial [Vibrio anguillarum]